MLLVGRTRVKDFLATRHWLLHKLQGVAAGRYLYFCFLSRDICVVRRVYLSLSNLTRTSSLNDDSRNPRVLQLSLTLRAGCVYEVQCPQCMSSKYGVFRPCTISTRNVYPKNVHL